MNRHAWAAVLVSTKWRRSHTTNSTRDNIWYAFFFYSVLVVTIWSAWWCATNGFANIVAKCAETWLLGCSHCFWIIGYNNRNQQEADKQNSFKHSFILALKFQRFQEQVLLFFLFSEANYKYSWRVEPLNETSSLSASHSYLCVNSSTY